MKIGGLGKDNFATIRTVPAPEKSRSLDFQSWFASATPIDQFASLVSSDIEDERIDLVRAALVIARTEYPDLDIEAYESRVEALGKRVAAKVRHPGDESETIEALNAVLYVEENITGNRENYYDPGNSFLNQVLDRKLGIPITLALLYMESARRAGLPLFGVGMPGHFLLKHYDVEGRELLIDAFEGGSLLTAKDCQRRLDEIYSGQMPLQPEFLVAITRRQWLTRMLNNLRSIYVSQLNFKKALPIADMILAIYPRSLEDVKQRAVLRYKNNKIRAALSDFEDYLKMSPEAQDADEIRQTTLSIRRMLASMN